MVLSITDDDFIDDVIGDVIDDVVWSRNRLYILLTSNTKLTWAEAYLRTKWHLDASSSLVTIKNGPKIGGLCPLFWGRGAGSPSSTMWPRPRPTSTPIAILIHPAVQPQ